MSDQIFDMAKVVNITKYQCSICGEMYSNEKEALYCESRPVTQDKDVKLGDVVVITQGDGTGKRAKVTEVYIINKDWGHYAWEKYWHTVALEAKIVDEWGVRTLTFDNYKTVNNDQNR